ncbi:MAG TPA: hypothetical protein VFJ24_04545 [Gaiellales bacterium]|nr:hypothetical protein [Gaiellales bacterium]
MFHLPLQFGDPRVPLGELFEPPSHVPLGVGEMLQITPVAQFLRDVAEALAVGHIVRVPDVRYGGPAEQPV